MQIKTKKSLVWAIFFIDDWTIYDLTIYLRLTALRFIYDLKRILLLTIGRFTMYELFTIDRFAVYLRFEADTNRQLL